MNEIVLLLKLCGVWLVCWAIACFINVFKFFYIAFDGNNAANCAIETAVFSFVIIMPFFPVLYLPVMFGLRWLLGGVKPKIIFPLVSAFLCFIPLGLIYLSKSRSQEQWTEALFDLSGEFHFVLLVTGFIFGVGFVWLLSKRDIEKGNGEKSLRILS